MRERERENHNSIMADAVRNAHIPGLYESGIDALIQMTHNSSFPKRLLLKPIPKCINNKIQTNKEKENRHKTKRLQNLT